MKHIFPPVLRSPAFGFTLIEMLVVISILSVLVALSFPVLNAVKAGGRVTAATNTLSVAIDGARSRARLEDDFGIGVFAGGLNGKYDGTAVVFTPSGECRLVKNYQFALDGSNRPLETSLPPRNGYIDIPGRDYINFPIGSGIAGMIRAEESSGTPLAGLRFLPPPFAVAFDEEGKLVAASPNEVLTASSANEDGHVYYDADADSQYLLDSDRGSQPDYDPDLWDARIVAGDFPGGNSKQVGDDDAGSETGLRRRTRLPFEKLETVVAVVVYDRQAFRGMDLNWADYVNSDGSPGSDFVAINGFLTQDDDQLAQILFFSPNTGAVIRN